MPQLTNDSTLDRIHAIQEKFPGFQVDGIVFSGMSNIRYLSGFTGSDGVLVLSSEGARLLVDGRYTAQAVREVRQIPVVQYDQ